jgi:AcrR family transcriptional regulator
VDTETQDAGPSLEAVTPRRKLSPGPGLGAQAVAAHQLARIYEALIQIVAERGYGSLKIRDVVARAEVSTRAFYEHFAGKEDCFSQTYDLVSRRATRRVLAAQAGERDWRRRAHLVFDEFAREVEQEPAAARLALIDIYGAGEAALAKAWRAERDFEGVLAEALARPPGGVVVPPLIVEGVVAGIAMVSRDRLLAGRVADLAGNGNGLVEWAMSYASDVATRLSDLDTRSVWRDTTLEALREADKHRPPRGDRDLILKAVAELAATKGYAGLTASRIRSTASVSNRKFDAHFNGVEDCWLAALDQQAAEAMAQSVRAQNAAAGPAGGVYRAIAALCDHVAGDPFLARVCLGDDFPPGREGVRSRKRLSEAIVEMLADGRARTSRLAGEAVIGAVWSLFQHHVLRDKGSRSRIYATLAYMVLTPAIGPRAAVEAIEREQSS